MRLNKFESTGVEPIGDGQDKRVFINPKNEKRIISETKEGKEKDTPKQLKGRYYLTKIVHLLLPDNIPDIYEAGESPDGTQNVDAERISHTPGHALLQKLRKSGGNKNSAKDRLLDELGKGAEELDLELERIGLGFDIDDINICNYTKDKKENVYYLETFKPWETDPLDSNKIELLFDEEKLRQAIDDISNPAVKEKCAKYLERILTLAKEERHKLREIREANLIASGPHIKEFENMIAPFVKEDVIKILNALTIEEEARNSSERETVKKALPIIESKLYFLKFETNITNEEYKRLYKKYKTLSRSVGIINRGFVDHTR